jgi:hypothetical protein
MNSPASAGPPGAVTSGSESRPGIRRTDRSPERRDALRITNGPTRFEWSDRLRILSRYLTREFLKFFLAATAGFVVIFYVIDVLDRMPDLVRHQAPLGATVPYFLFKLPQVIFYVMPVSVLVATLFVLSILTRTTRSSRSVHRRVRSPVREPPPPWCPSRCRPPPS